MIYPEAYIDYLAHFNGTKDYFECHEVLEEYWKDYEPGVRDSVWVVLIQLAVSIYHYRRGNIAGAAKLLKSSQRKWPKRKEELEKLGLDGKEIEKLFIRLNGNYQEHIPYQAIHLPIKERILEEKVKERCQEWKTDYKKCDDINDYYLINKHRLRDRSSVIQERLDNLSDKNKPLY
ncbi:DUF309 domain-containing protein [Thalassobacillus pellis]|uniref:DUF309 domain-containing protein n=1 Tax=Thalassobacillus pellis TaxID=748008 RepID=UPI001960457A|nr:DUF309 domain-containing protein [Thalassobacillus pellis]MBM7552409.1 putative metal-dependent hydrolase [Thalassobacillus pellis]